MPVTASPYYRDPYMGQITSNLATAIFGDPETRMKRDLYGAQTADYQARTAKTNLESDRLRIGNQDYGDLPAIQADMAPLPGESPAQTAYRTAAARGRFLRAYPNSNVDQAANATGSLLSNIFAVAPDDNDKRTSLVLQGKIPGINFAGTDQRADAVAARNAAADRTTKFGVASIEQAGADRRNSATIAGQNWRHVNTPINVGQGDTAYLAPSDPRSTTLGEQLFGMPTKTTVEGQAGRQIMALPDGQEPSSVLAQIFSGTVGPGRQAKPRAVSEKSIQDAVLAGVRGIKGAVDETYPAKPVVLPEFEASFDPAKVKAARDAAASEIARSGDVQRAGAAYANVLGVRPGDTFKQPGLLGSLFGAKAGVTSADSQSPPKIEHVDQLPPPAQRKAGMIINSPRGQVQWTGHGWVPAQNRGAVY